jgi:hypothetical protein
MRLGLFAYYLAMAILSLLAPQHGRMLIDDAEEAVRRRRERANVIHVGDRL